MENEGEEDSNAHLKDRLETQEKQQLHNNM